MGPTEIFVMLGGLGLFLYGMKMMGEGLELAAGPRMKDLLEKITSNRVFSVLIGIMVTAIIQSSSATTVMVVGFVNARLIDLTQAVGVIMGANIGTTVTAQLIALDLDMIAPAAVFVGVILMQFTRKNVLKYIGQVLAGLGILFIGMSNMSDAMEPLHNVQWFQNLLTGFKNPLVGLLAGAVFTGIIQSSSASVGIIQALAAQGLIGLDSAIYVLFGQNIGTCVTTLLATMGANRTAKRAGLIHLLFNVIGTALFLIIVAFVPFVEIIESISPNSVVSQIANAHTVFNVVTTLLLLPCVNLLVKLACKLIPGEDEELEELRLKFVDDRILMQPSIAAEMIHKEVTHMYIVAQKNLIRALDAFLARDKSQNGKIEREEKRVNYLNHQIAGYLVKCNALELTEQDSKMIGGFHHVINDIERIGDHAENIGEYTTIAVDNKVHFSDEARTELIEMRNRIVDILDKALILLESGVMDAGVAYRVATAEEEIDELTIIMRDHHIERLNKGKCSAQVGILYTDIVTDLERVADHAMNIAFSVGSIPKEELAESAGIAKP